jgi:hypothetical protein
MCRHGKRGLYIVAASFICAGMTCTVVTKDGAAPEIGLGIRKVIAAIFGASSS